MNRQWFSQLSTQLNSIWQSFQFYQKASIVFVSTAIIGFFLYLMVSGPNPELAPIFLSEEILSPADVAEIKTLLDQDGVPYKAQGHTLFVPKDKVQKVRLDLVASGYPKTSQEKGFELFDSNTWIKGEKELQILELRAIKGQLEKDITQFDNVRSASVILDIAPPRPFGGSMYKTKASVILNVVPGARISPSELRAITFHVTGAVRGLSPNMVAISDTSGKLYQPIDPDGNTDLIRSAESALEEQLKAKIDGMLALVVGLDNFYSSVQIVMNREKTSEERKVYSGTVDGVNLGSPVTTQLAESSQVKAEVGGNRPSSPLNFFRESKQEAVPLDSIKVSSGPGKIESISVAVLLDKQATMHAASAYPNPSQQPADVSERLRHDIQNQIDTILKGYTTQTRTAVDVAEFDPSRLALHQTIDAWVPARETSGWNALSIGFVMIAVLGVLAAFKYAFQTTPNTSQKTPSAKRSLEDEMLSEDYLNQPTSFSTEDLNGFKETTEKTASYPNPWVNERKTSTDNTLFDLLQTADPDALATLLEKEKPTTAAFLLSYLSKNRIRAILSKMSGKSQTAIASSLADFETLPPEYLSEIEATLSEKWGSLPNIHREL